MWRLQLLLYSIFAIVDLNEIDVCYAGSHRGVGMRPKEPTNLSEVARKFLEKENAGRSTFYLKEAVKMIGDVRAKIATESHLLSIEFDVYTLVAEATMQIFGKNNSNVQQLSEAHKRKGCKKYV